MTSRRQYVTTLTIALLTSACGGEGVSGSGSTMTPSIVTPTPTPAPTPTPTPTPISYANASDFTRDRSYTAIGYELAFGSGSDAPMARLDPESSSIGFDFTASTRTYQARYNAASITATTQSMTAYDPPFDQVRGPTSSFTRSPFILGYSATGSAMSASYFGYVSWSVNGILRYLLFGARTVASDLPTAGVATATGGSMLTSTFAYGGGGGDSSVVIDFAARTITGTTAFYPASLGGTGSSLRPPPAAQPITFTATLDPLTGRVSGTAANTVSGATGTIEGAFYGARGFEIGLLISLTGPDGTIIYGIIGARQ